MSDARADAPSWIIGGALLIAGVLVSALGLAPASPTGCDWPTSADGVQGLSGADALRDRMGGPRGDALVWFVGTWGPAGPRDGRVEAQFLLSSSVSEFALHPLWMTSAFEFVTDETRVASFEGIDGPVPTVLRISRVPGNPFVEGWAYAFGLEAVESPVDFLLRRAFSHPFTPAPPITVISAVHEAGYNPTSQRVRVVTDRLEALWRDWESSCRL